jgi:hypothetical protein
MRKLVIAGLLTAAAACAQTISIGAIAGVPFADAVAAKTINGIEYLPQSPNFTFGGSFQLNLPFRLRLELDALARRASFSASNLVNNVNSTEWRFPVIFQYRLNHGTAFQPFLGVGTSFSHIYQIENAITSGTGSFATNSPAGMLIDGGLDFKLKLFRLSTELRYTRQFSDSVQNISQLNQAEVLVGVHF